MLCGGEEVRVQTKRGSARPVVVLIVVGLLGLAAAIGWTLAPGAGDGQPSPPAATEPEAPPPAATNPALPPLAGPRAPAATPPATGAVPQSRTEAPPTTTILGRVVDLDGRPVTPATVRVREEFDHDAGATTEVDDQGRFRIELVPDPPSPRAAARGGSTPGPRAPSPRR